MTTTLLAPDEVLGVLATYDAMTASEIAAHLGLTAYGATRRVHEILEQLRAEGAVTRTIRAAADERFAVAYWSVA